MNDKSDPTDRSESRLEEELRKLRPLALSESLLTRMRDTADERLTLGDQVLAFCSGIGALAATFIVMAVVWRIHTSPQPPAMSPQDVEAHQQMAAEYRAVMASL